MQEFELPSTGGGRLHCGLWPAKASEPDAIVQLVHGISEHIGRYEEFGRFLSAHNILMVADDHMGHGKSIGPDDTPCFFPGGWTGAVDDERALLDRTRAEYPSAPYFLLGHSMGSFLARTFLFRHAGAGLRGAILSGTGWQNGMKLRAGLKLCRMQEKKYGERGVSELLMMLMFGGFNRPFRPNRTPVDWLSRDPAMVDANCADPLCGFPTTVGLARDMFRGMSMNQDPKNLSAMPRDLPVLFFSGARDPVGDMGRGVQRAARAFRDAGVREVTVRLYPEGRHEMLNETNRAEVFSDVLHWLQAHGAAPR